MADDMLASVKPYDAVLFDLDGTLLDTAPEIAGAVNAALQELGLPAADEAVVRRFIGHGVRQTLAQAYDHVAPNTDAPKREADLDIAMLAFARHYARLAPQSQPFADVLESLKVLRAVGVKCAIVSNKESRFVSQLLDGSGLPAFIDLTICGDTLARKKPDPLPIVHALRSFGVLRERALFVGDSSIDVACARNAGVAIWLVPYGYNGGQPAESAGADRVIPTIAEVAHACTTPARAIVH